MSIVDLRRAIAARPSAWAKSAAIVAVTGVVVALGCGGGGGGSCTPSSDISGNWSGPTADDTIARGNPGVVNASFSQIGCNVTGSWSFDFQDSHLDSTRSVVGGPPSKSRLSLKVGNSVESCDPVTGFCSTVKGCIYDIEGTVVSPAEIVGTYATGQNCSQSQQGSFDIKFVSPLAPTPTPVALPTLTPAPTVLPTP